MRAIQTTITALTLIVAVTAALLPKKNAFYLEHGYEKLKVWDALLDSFKPVGR